MRKCIFHHQKKNPVLAPFPSVTSLMKTFLTQDGPPDVIADAVAASDETIAEDEEEPSKDTGVTDGTHATPLPPSESGSLSLQVCEDVEPRAVPTNTQQPHSTPKVKRVNIQHVLSSQLQLCNRASLVESFTDTKDKARLMCLTAKTTGMWLCPTKHTSRDGIWIAHQILSAQQRGFDWVQRSPIKPSHASNAKPRELQTRRSRVMSSGTTRCAA